MSDKTKPLIIGIESLISWLNDCQSKVILNSELDDFNKRINRPALAAFGKHRWFKSKLIGIDLHELDQSLNILLLARKRTEVKDALQFLSNIGYVLYSHSDCISRFVHHSHIRNFWRRVITGEILEYKDIFYTVENPKQATDSSKLLVIFSSMADPIYAATISGRCFTQNFKTIAKYIPEDTYILRIVDIGGALTGYYCNTVYLTENQKNIQSLISMICQHCSVPKDRTVLYGGSKGATAALLHGVLGGYNFIATDPILDDEYYIKRYNDSHFVSGVYLEPKTTLFQNVLNRRLSASYNCIITSDRSPQYPYIQSILLKSPAGQDIICFNSQNSDIHDHPQVSLKTINLVTTMINGILYGIIKTGAWTQLVN